MGKTAYGEGSIYQRADGRWSAQLDMGWRNGKRQRKLIYGRTRREVQDRLRAALKAKQEGTLRVGSRQSTGKFLQRWLEDSVKPSVRPATYSMYWHLTTRHLIPNLDRVPLEKLSPEHVQALLRAKTDEGLAPRTVHHLRALLRIALNRAMRWGLVARNAAALADSPRIERFEVRMLAPAEAKQLLAAAEDDRLGALYSVALALGLRQGEALGLSWEDVDFESRRLHVRHGLQRIAGKLRLVEPKTRQSRRTIALPAVVIDALQHHRAKQSQERLLAGTPMARDRPGVHLDDRYTDRSGKPPPLLLATSGKSPPASDALPRPQTLVRIVTARPGRFGTGGDGNARPLEHQHHDGHVYARVTGTAAPGC